MHMTIFNFRMSCYRLMSCCAFITVCTLLSITVTTYYVQQYTRPHDWPEARVNKLNHHHVQQQQVHSSLIYPNFHPIDNSSNVEFEQPDIYLHPFRFDILIKLVYAYFHAKENDVPGIIVEAYAEHIRAFNRFREHCNKMDKSWFDAGKPCTDKRTLNDFIVSYTNTINSIKKDGFNSSVSRIPVDQAGFVLNGAHRLAAAVVLSYNVSFDHMNYTRKRKFVWDYNYFLRRGLSVRLSDIMVFEWMKIQVKLVHLKTKVFIISLFSNDVAKNERVHDHISNECSDGVLYERKVNVTKQGMRQLVTYMYGYQSWLDAKIDNMLSKFTSSTYTVQFLFIYVHNIDDLVRCKHEIRAIYNARHFTSSVHTPDTLETNLILAEMILNNNSIQFMNSANNAVECKRIAEEIALRASISSINALPDIFVGKEDIMIDSGAIRGYYSSQNQTDVEILFLHAVDRSILGNQHGMSMQGRVQMCERPLSEDHFCKTDVKNKWDLFVDTDNYGYCYGIKFVSLK